MLMADAGKRLFDVVLVWRFDRFARSTIHLVSALETFRHLKIDFISYNEQIDTSSPMGADMFTIGAAFAELEHRIIKERVTADVRQAIKKRKSWGREPVEQADPTITPTICKLQRDGLGATGSASGWACHHALCGRCCNAKARPVPLGSRPRLPPHHTLRNAGGQGGIRSCDVWSYTFSDFSTKSFCFLPPSSRVDTPILPNP